MAPASLVRVIVATKKWPDIIPYNYRSHCNCSKINTRSRIWPLHDLGPCWCGTSLKYLWNTKSTLIPTPGKKGWYLLTNNPGESTINLLVRKDVVEQPDKQFNKKSPKGLLPGSFSYLLLIESVAIEARASFIWEQPLSLPTQSLIIYSRKMVCMCNKICAIGYIQALLIL